MDPPSKCRLKYLSLPKSLALHNMFIRFHWSAVTRGHSLDELVDLALRVSLQCSWILVHLANHCTSAKGPTCLLTSPKMLITLCLLTSYIMSFSKI
jgi:hypothetical protein